MCSWRLFQLPLSTGEVPPHEILHEMYNRKQALVFLHWLVRIPVRHQCRETQRKESLWRRECSLSLNNFHTSRRDGENCCREACICTCTWFLPYVNVNVAHFCLRSLLQLPNKHRVVLIKPWPMCKWLLSAARMSNSNSDAVWNMWH